MTNLKTTKRALISSVVALFVCFAMLLGTTFAWFTDEATSSGNIIQSGKLDVNMYWAEGNLDPEAAETQWTEAKSGPIFNNDKWEPGYVEAKHIKIANEGTLALKYQMRILANGIVSELADVIDVYYFYEIEEGNEEDLTGAVQLNRASFTEANRLGTLSEVLNVTYDKNIANTISGTLEKETYKTLTLAFKMQESAGNEYQDLSLGADFSIQIIATQYTFEKDSFDTNYDAGADFAPQTTPTATVYQLSKSKLESITIGGFDGAILDTGYSFQPTETAEQGIASEAANWHADFFVYADADVPANSMALAGYYKAFEGFSFGGTTLSATNWIGLTAPTDIKAGEGLRLIADGMNEGNTLSGITVPYNAICSLGNDGVGFLCGAADLTGANEGTTLTVELRLYKTLSEEECLEQNGFKSENYETGEYITIGTFTYTFDNPNVEYLADGSRVRYGENGEVILESVDKVIVTNGTYYVPDGVTTIAACNNSDFDTIVLSDTVKVVDDYAFSQISASTIILNEGLEEIGNRAFQKNTNLTSIEFPSTLKTIEPYAFQGTGLTTVEIPEGIENIGQAAFAYNQSIETIVINGNPVIGDGTGESNSSLNYVGRACPNLKSVYINGEPTYVTTGMLFSNAESGDASNITMYFTTQAACDAYVAATAYDNYKTVVTASAQTTISTQDGTQSLTVEISKPAADSIVYHSEMNQYAGNDVKNKIGAITVYSKADLQAALQLAEAGIFVYNGGNDIHPVINFAADIDFGGDDFVGFGMNYNVNGNGHTLYNINFVANADGKAGFINYAGNNVITGLTIKNATATGAQAGIFCGNAQNVQIVDCALEGNITINWAQNVAEAYNGVGAVWGVIAGDDRNSIECDTTNVNITVNKDGITYPTGYTSEGHDLVGAVYGGSYAIVVDGVAHKAITVANTAAFQNALNNTDENDYIFLVSGVTYETVTIANPIAKNVTVFGAEGAVVKGMACDFVSFTPDTNKLYGFTLQNVAFEGKGFYLTGMSNQAPWGFVENFTMDGCSFKGNNKDDTLGNKLFDFATSSPGSHQFINLKITNCTVDTAIQGIMVGGLRGECEISGNVISNVAHNGIAIRSVQEGTVLVKGNEINNCSDRALRVNQNSATINFVDNIIVNCSGDPDDGSLYKSGSQGSNAVENFSGNTVDGEAWNPIA